jgi:hypothetical protein
MCLVSLFSFIALGLTINYIDPEKSGIAGQVIFYLISFFLLSSLINLLLLWIRKRALGSEAVALNVGLSLRQGMLIALFVIGLLILQSMRVLIWWDGLLLLAGVFIVELYFLSRSA